MKQIVCKLLKRAAKRYIKRHKPYIIATAWSVGKTTARSIIAQTIRQLVPDTSVYTSSQNYNTEIGLCLSILTLEKRSTNPFRLIGTLFQVIWLWLFWSRRYDILVAEYWIDTPGDMTYLLSIAHPDMTIFTVLDKVHAQQLWSPDEILEEKAKIFAKTKDVIFLSTSSLSYTRKYTDDLDVDVLVYSFDKHTVQEADIRRRNKEFGINEAGLPYSQFILEQWNDSVQTIKTNLLNDTDAWYISLAVECAMIIGLRVWQKITPDEALESVDQLCYTQQPWRFSLFPGQWWSILIDSTYNASPKSIKSVINTAIALRNSIYKDFDLIYCLGDMRELWTFSEQEHRALASYISQSADYLYLVWSEMQAYMLDELEKVWFNADRIKWFESSVALGKALLEDLSKREHRWLVVFKGSQNTIFLEEAVSLCLKNPEDRPQLVRQSAFWQSKKNNA